MQHCVYEILAYEMLKYTQPFKSLGSVRIKKEEEINTFIQQGCIKLTETEWQ